MKHDSQSRKKYWDKQYHQYWHDRVAEAKTYGVSTIVPGDPKTEDDEVYQKVFENVKPVNGNILDVGCAWGRMFTIYKEMNLKISGVDISPSMISEAKEKWGKDLAVEFIGEYEAENLPFSDQTFNNVAILAVFDATFQEAALNEILRVLAVGGRLYLTGKNDRYACDDKHALSAEIGARKKKHPNFFTDVTNLTHQLIKQGHTIIARYYFVRRGDFGKFHFQINQPTKFYEYFFVIEKGKNSSAFEPFSSEMSQNYKKYVKASQ